MPPNNAPVEATTTCIQCGYDLRELTSERCPECGWVIDWALARDDEEHLRPGTPAYQFLRQMPVRATFASLIQMLFRPARFARKLRWDEPLWPALAIAALAYIIAFTWPTISSSYRGMLNGHATYCAAILTCITVNCMVFAFSWSGGHTRMTFRRRFRLFLLVSLYGNCFVAVWTWSDPPYIEALTDANFLWPMNGDFLSQFESLFEDLRFTVRTIIFYWWATILLIVCFNRIKPRWRVLFVLPMPVISGFAATQVGLLIAD